MAFCQDNSDVKVASKGISKNNKFKYEEYKSALYHSVKYDAVNFSIREHRGIMCSLKSKKLGLNNVHVKTFVNADRVQTTPHLCAQYSIA